MKNIILKKSIAITVSVSLLFSSSSFAAGTPVLASGAGDIVCKLNSEATFFPIGDSRGNNILTKREVIRDCNITITEQGACKKWRETNEDRGLNPGRYNAYESKNYSDSIGSLLSAIGAYDQIEHIWSGWKGYCEIGTKSDFSWAEDPMFWASMAMSFIMAETAPPAASTTPSTPPGDALATGAVSGSSTTVGTTIETGVGNGFSVIQQGAIAAPKEGLLVGTVIDKGVNGLAESIGAMASNTVESISTTIAENGGNYISNGIDQITSSVKESFLSAENAFKAGINNASNSIGFGEIYSQNTITSATTATLKETAKQTLQQAYVNIGRCILAAGFDIATTVYEFAKPDGGKTMDCDPVDEVCGSGPGGETESEIKTMDEGQFNDLVEQFASQNPPQDIRKYLTVFPAENGIISYKVKVLNEMNGVANMDQSAMDDMIKKMKMFKMELSVGLTVLSLASCMGGHSGASTATADSGGDRASVRTMGTTAIDFAAKFAGPWGAVAAVALKLALYAATSYKNVDTCHDEDDAKEAGKREERTQKALKHDLCHEVKVECAEHSALSSGAIFSSPCVLDGYTYCCYDQIMTKILVEQLKAQLGRDWAHCTGISIRDLNFISFRQCSDTEKTIGIDGAHQTGIYNPTQAFQYQKHCIDMTEFLEYLNALMSTEIDMSDFEAFWNDITEQSPHGETLP